MNISFPARVSRKLISLTFGLLIGSGLQYAAAEVPHLLNYQGRVVVDHVNFDGTGEFRFALVDELGSTTHWSNDGSSISGSEPSLGVSLPVSGGLYSVLLGDDSLTNMDALPPSAFVSGDVWLRVWFDDGVNGSVLLSPDQRVASVGYALMAAQAGRILLEDVVAPPTKPVLAWGDNDSGQVSVPPELADVSAIAGGDSHSLVLLDNGPLVRWGDEGPLTPTDPDTLVGVKQIAAGAGHSLALLGNGTVAAWGRNHFLQSNVPPALANVIAIAAGEKHSLALQAGGTVEAWGDDTFDQTTIPAAVTDIIAIAAGADHCLALKGDGTVVAWGRNDAGQTGVPAGLDSVVAIAAGAFHSLALKSDGTVVAWGWDQAGQSTVPDDLTGVTAVTGGYGFSAALKSDGTVVAWGDNSDGQISEVSTLRNIGSLSAGFRHLLALQIDLIPASVARLDQDNLFTAKVGIGRAPVTNALEVNGQASKSTAGNWVSNSDGRIKRDIEAISGALEMIDRLNPVTFHYTAEHLAQHPEIEDVRYFNVIAQEFREVFPDAVRVGGDRLSDGTQVLQVDTYPATVTNLAAVKELHGKLKEKDAEIADLKERLDRIEQQMRK